MDWTPILTNLAAGFVPIAGTVITAAVGIGVKYAVAYMAAKTKSERVQSALFQLAQATINAVMDTENQVRQYMSDGVLSKDEQAQLRNDARTRVQAQVPAALKTLTDAGYADLNAYINGQIEKAVSQMPDSNPKPARATEATAVK